MIFREIDEQDSKAILVFLNAINNLNNAIFLMFDVVHNDKLAHNSLLPIGILLFPYMLCQY
jgi:hypothetical protein